MLKKTKLCSALMVACGGVLLSAGQAANAQAASDTQQLERVEITGSNIRRVDTETPSPVQVITAADMKASGYTSVQDVLHNITANGQGTLSQSFNLAFASGAGGIALRGLTTAATLVLIDGHRMAPYPIGDDGQRSFVDVANIPFDSIEKIEILKDGASAVYGSDAIAGVVNIILKRSFVGTTVTADAGTRTRATQIPITRRPLSAWATSPPTAKLLCFRGSAQAEPDPLLRPGRQLHADRLHPSGRIQRHAGRAEPACWQSAEKRDRIRDQPGEQHDCRFHAGL